MTEEASIAYTHPIISILKLYTNYTFNLAIYYIIIRHIILLLLNSFLLLILLSSPEIALHDIICII